LFHHVTLMLPSSNVKRMDTLPTSTEGGRISFFFSNFINKFVYCEYYVYFPSHKQLAFSVTLSVCKEKGEGFDSRRRALFFIGTICGNQIPIYITVSMITVAFYYLKGIFMIYSRFMQQRQHRTITCDTFRYFHGRNHGN
jgi:hypothetical protein